MPVSSWDLYERRLNALGRRGRDRAILRERDAILRKYLNSPSLKDVDINGVSHSLVVHSTDTPSEKTFNTLPDDIVNLGDIILWEQMHWLVTQVDFDDEITRSGRMVQCNRQIRWQNRNTGEIIERWCLVTKPYTSNIEKGMVIASSNREFKIQVSYDEETRLIDLDRRFLLEEIAGEPKAYEVVSVDAQTNRYQDIDGGFLIWNLSQGEYNPMTDSRELMIADYVDPSELPGLPGPMPKMSIAGAASIRCGTSRVYRVIVAEEPQEAPSPVWSVAIPDGLEDAVSVDLQDGACRISVADVPSAVGCRLRLSAKDESGRYDDASFTLEVTELL